MDKAKIFYAEDDESLRKINVLLLEDEGHQVVLQADNLKQAMEAIENGRLRELGVNIAIVDGNLTRGDCSCSDGFTVSKEIRGTGLPIKIIAFSGSLKDDAAYGDVYVDKGDRIQVLFDAISSL